MSVRHAFTSNKNTKKHETSKTIFLSNEKSKLGKLTYTYKTGNTHIHTTL